MIDNFGNGVAEDIWNKEYSRKLPKGFHVRAKDLMSILYNVADLKELGSTKVTPSLRLHQLKGDRKGDWAVDIDKTSGWRITFRFENGLFRDVKIENYH